MPSERKFIVYRRMIGTQMYEVTARSKAEARRKVLTGDAEGIDFRVTDASNVMAVYAEGEWRPPTVFDGDEGRLSRDDGVFDE